MNKLKATYTTSKYFGLVESKKQKEKRLFDLSIAFSAGVTAAMATTKIYFLLIK